ncbi:pleckstrin homology domain-containing family S member 1-like [Garra rufa]|uniref:pleckstrin homology domain-containing family S member 1-like n=1 Tax=Garra rufa TaxID=137080 RepID=UPI003CCEF520
MNIRRKSAEVEEVCTGFLLKSPPARQIKNAKSWKRRFFVLSKTNNGCHELKYYKTSERDKPIKSIDGSTITVVQKDPKEYPVFEWICKTFKCSQSSVLFMKTENPRDKVPRDFFFIGDSSDYMDRWLNALNGVIMNNHIKPQTERLITTESTSNGQTLKSDTEEAEADNKPPLPPRKKLIPSVEATTQQSQRSQPPECSPSETPVYDNVIKKEPLDETAVESNDDMSSGESMTATSEDSLLDSVTKAFNAMKTPETSDGQRIHGIQETSTNNKNSCFDFNGNSETHTFIEKEICISQNEAKSLVISEEDGKPCVSDCGEIEASSLFHKGDQILAVNDLLTDTVEDVQTYLRRLSKSEVKLTIRRLPGSIPLDSESC